MKTKALVCTESQQFSLEDVTLPVSGDAHVGIRTLYSGISVGTEFALIRNRLSWGPFPIITGYMAVGEVEHVGKKVQGYEAGQTVYFRRSLPMTLSTGKVCSSVSGTHAAYALIDHDATPTDIGALPKGISLKAASSVVMPCVGLHGADLAQPRVGEIAVVIGAGLVGLGAINALANRGCRVLVTDLDPKRLELALAFGAEAVSDVRKEKTADFVARYAKDGADVVFECTGLPSQLIPAMKLCRRFGKFVYQGNYGAAPYQTEFLPAHGRQLTCYYPCDDGGIPCRDAALRLIASGSLPWEKSITHEVKASDSPAFFQAINEGKVEGLVGGIINWQGVS